MGHARTFITGGSGGIGSACVRELIARGSRVCAPTHSECDVRVPAHLSYSMAHAAREMGGLDAVIACAGVRHAPGSTDHLREAYIYEVLDVNLRGALFTAKEAIRFLTETRGHLVLISSVSALTPAPGSAAYAASKAGVRALGMSIAKEHRDDMKVTTMTLGATDTPIWGEADKYPREKMLRPDDVARSIADVLETPWHVSVDEMVLLPRDSSVRPLGW